MAGLFVLGETSLHSSQQGSQQTVQPGPIGIMLQTKEATLTLIVADPHPPLTVTRR